jgi:putative transposase
MPRPSRVVLAGVPLHITQRGVDRCTTFRTEEDFAYYSWALGEALAESGCALHAYVLMTNHVHLLLTPQDVEGPASLFRSLGRRYVRQFNKRHGRTGTLWEGRFHSAVVDSVPYFFACSRYIEMNPVRAKLTDEPQSYEWTSAHHNVAAGVDPLIAEHPSYLALGRSREARRAAYRAMFSVELSADTIACIRATQVSRSRGGRRAESRPRGTAGMEDDAR